MSETKTETQQKPAATPPSETRQEKAKRLRREGKTGKALIAALNS